MCREPREVGWGGGQAGAAQAHIARWSVLKPSCRTVCGFSPALMSLWAHTAEMRLDRPTSR